MASIGAALHEIVRDAPLGQLMRFLSRNRVFHFPEEQPDFNLPEPWIQVMNNTDVLEESKSHSASATASAATSSMESKEQHVSEQDGREQQCQQQHQSEINPTTLTDLENYEVLEKVNSIPVVPKRTRDGDILVDWYDTDDPANPHNWSNSRRGLFATLIWLYTFVVYSTSSIYTSSEQGIMEKFGVSNLKATLGLAIYVLGYGVGPLIFSPLSEIPRIGRSPIYIITMFLFVILSIPTAVVSNFPGLMVLRFLQGFFGSPCLASGGASMQDMYSMISLPFAMIAWVSAAFCGPAIGPLLGGFAVPVEGWRWPLYESIWASSPVLIAIFLFLPETSTPNILLRRAERLRKLTGDQRFKSQSEINQRHMTVSAVTIDALIKPMEISVKDPAVLFVQIYSAITYGIYYSYFEVFPLVYPVLYNMNLGETGLVFLCIFVGCIIAIAAYGTFLYFVVTPQIKKFGMGPQEQVLLPALAASFGPPIGLFLFAWTARASIHWIVPTIGIAIYACTVFIVFQSNDFFRSAFACGSVLFAHPLYKNLGVSKGTSLLGGLSLMGIIGMWLLFYFGAKLRALSRFALYTKEK